jgi:hypothetical protein
MKMAGRNRVATISCGVFSVFILGGLGGLRVQALPRIAQSPQVPGAVASQAAPAVAAPEYPQTADGFNAQMSAALAEYQKGDRNEGRRLLEEFRLPDSAKWFAEQFGSEQGETLSKRYDRLFESYVNFMEEKLEEVASKKGRKLNMNLGPGTSQQPGSSRHSGPLQLSGIVPAKEPTCFNVNFGIQLTGKADLVFKGDFKAAMWEDTFVYQAGEFRFLGHGAWPFWVWQDRP